MSTRRVRNILPTPNGLGRGKACRPAVSGVLFCDVLSHSAEPFDTPSKVLGHERNDPPFLRLCVLQIKIDPPGTVPDFDIGVVIIR